MEIEATETLTPPPGSEVPTDDAAVDETPAPVAPATEDAAEKVVKLPASVKAPKPNGANGSSRFQGRISELVAQRKEAEARAAGLETALTKMQGPKSTERGATPGRDAPASGDALNPDDFPTYGEYIKELAKQTVAQEREASKSQAAQESYTRHMAERNQSFREEAAPFEASYGEGFWDAITDPSLPVSEVMSNAVLELDGGLGPLTMLYLASHRDEAAKISRMNPMASVVQIGKIAARLDYEMKHGEAAPANIEAAIGDNGTPPTPVPPVPAVPRRPAPTAVPALRGATPSDLSGEPSDKDDIQTWVAKEAARMRAKNPHARFYAG